MLVPPNVPRMCVPMSFEGVFGLEVWNIRDKVTKTEFLIFS